MSSIADQVPTASDRTVGLWGATGVGVGAIVGGGILVLAGVAFAATGPGAMAAFALNGLVAFVTAMSFAEISSSFPESGGAYTFAKKVLSVRAAFAVGWVLWFAYIVAGVLYALGFAAFAALALSAAWNVVGAEPPWWLADRRFHLLLATTATAAYAISLVRKSSGGGQLATVGKVVVFVAIIAVGLLALVRQPLGDSGDALSPFLPNGFGGLLSAMGFTFIALQGFDLIAAIAGEVKEPGRNIPRAMFLSLGAALVIYIPLLLVVSTVGVPPGTTIGELAARNPETVIATAVRGFMGPVGYWLVIVAAILSTLSALNANLMAASRVALSMARDRTLPDVLGGLHATRKTPLMAVYATALTLVAILFMVPDLAAAGAAASLIFLLSFTLAHVTAYLARVRGAGFEGGYLTPLFPLVPIGGGLACAALGVFQAIRVPQAGGIVVIWAGLGVILYVALFRARAETFDASSEALDPRLARLRGKNPLVLVPIANPAHARAMVEIANAMAPSDFARVLLLSIVSRRGDDPLAHLDDAQRVVREALTVSYEAGQAPEALITAAADPWAEIRRVAQLHECASLLIGLGQLPEHGRLLGELETLIRDVDSDVAVMRAPEGWTLASAQRVLVPIGGRGEQHGMRARLLGAISRSVAREVTFLTVLDEDADQNEVAETLRDTTDLAEVKVPGGSAKVEVVRAADATAVLLEKAAEHDLMVLGLRSARGGRGAFSEVVLGVARRAPCACILLSRRASGYAELARPLREVANVIPWRAPVR